MKEKIYIITTTITNEEEGTEVRTSIIKATKNEKIAEDTMAELFNEITETYEENGFAFNEEDKENENRQSITIMREDMLETIEIATTIMEVE